MIRCANSLASTLLSIAGLYDNEFIAAEPGDEILHSCQRVQTISDRIEQKIAAIVAERIVHFFEMIDIDKVYGDLPAD